jgi:hypothetical protein
MLQWGGTRGGGVTNKHLGEKWIPDQEKMGFSPILLVRGSVENRRTGDGITRHPCIFRQTRVPWKTKFSPSHRNFELSTCVMCTVKQQSQMEDVCSLQGELFHVYVHVTLS